MVTVERASLKPCKVEALIVLKENRVRVEQFMLQHGSLMNKERDISEIQPFSQVTSEVYVNVNQDEIDFLSGPASGSAVFADVEDELLSENEERIWLEYSDSEEDGAE